MAPKHCRTRTETKGNPAHILVVSVYTILVLVEKSSCKYLSPYKLMTVNDGILKTSLNSVPGPLSGSIVAHRWKIKFERYLIQRSFAFERERVVGAKSPTHLFCNLV